MKIKLLLLSSIIPLSLSAQLTGHMNTLSELANSKQFTNVPITNGSIMDPNDYSGSPYFNNNFLPSTIIGQQGTYQMRYNIYNDEIILQNNDDQYYRLPKTPEFSSIIINGKDTIKLINDKYYLILDSSEQTAIVKKINVKYYPPKPSPDGYQPDIKARFAETKSEYYYQHQNGLIPIGKEMDEFYSIFPDKKNTIKNYLKKNNLKNDGDYIKFYNDNNLK